MIPLKILLYQIYTHHLGPTISPSPRPKVHGSWTTWAIARHACELRPNLLARRSSSVQRLLVFVGAQIQSSILSYIK